MTKSKLEKSLYKQTNGCPWISTDKLRKWYGRGYEKFKTFAEGLDRRVEGNRVEFFIPDVAEKMYLNEVVKG